jgi:pyruvate dehydrogenase E2 component (dihydrolipoamide acetyltransferase)
MANVVIMPKQGQSVESCIITEFYKKKGDTVSVGDLLFAYETDKASFEEESKFEGTILDVFFDEGDEVPVLENVLVVGNEGESVDEFRPGGEEADAEEEIKVEAKAEVSRQAGTSPSADGSSQKVEEKVENSEHDVKIEGSGFVSPRAKKTAEGKGIDTTTLEGSGPKGRVIERDVIEAAENSPKMSPLAKKMAKEDASLKAESGSGLAGTVKGGDLAAGNPVYGSDFAIKPLSNMRKLIAKTMHASLQNSAQLTHHLGADARNILALRKMVKAAMAEGYPVNITLNDMICFATIKALKKFPQVNAHFMGESVKYFNKVHLGLAVDTDRGLMVPAIKNADDLSISGLASQFKEVAEACRKGSIDPDLLSPEAASFTVSNLGNYGVEMFTPVINLPQAAILGVNTIVPRPKDLGDGVYGFVPYIGLSLTYDHRALDGGEATRFVKQVAVEIENLEINL